MMKALIVGAGLQGAACAAIMSKDQMVTGIVIADIDKGLAQQVAKKIDSPKVGAAEADATKTEEVAKLAEGCDVILDFVLPWMAPYVMKAALKVGAHYVNAAFDAPYWEQIIKGEALYLDKEFKEAGLFALLGCGGEPGLLNVGIARYVNKMDSVESITMRSAFASTDEDEERLGPWNPGWSPEQAFVDFLTEPVILKDGKLQKAPIFSDQEDFVFPEPVGEIFMSNHSHEEVYSLTQCYKEKGLKNCSFKYFVDEVAASFIYMGFIPGKEIEVKGQKVKPFDVLMALTPHPGHAFLEEEPPDSPEPSMVCMCYVDITGTEDGTPVSYRIDVPYNFRDNFKTYQNCGTVHAEVALPAFIGAKVCLEEKSSGILFPEQLNVDRFLELMNEKVNTGIKEIFKK